jgi:hypothetical protein
MNDDLAINFAPFCSGKVADLRHAEPHVEQDWKVLYPRTDIHEISFTTSTVQFSLSSVVRTLGEVTASLHVGDTP